MSTRTTSSVLWCLLILLPLCSGCSWFTEYVYVHERFPIITKPEPPKLTVITSEDLAPLSEGIRNQIINNVVELRRYREQIDTAVDTYNAAAKDHNKKKETSP